MRPRGNIDLASPTLFFSLFTHLGLTTVMLLSRHHCSLIIGRVELGLSHAHVTAYVCDLNEHPLGHAMQALGKPMHGKKLI